MGGCHGSNHNNDTFGCYYYNPFAGQCCSIASTPLFIFLYTFIACLIIGFCCYLAKNKRQNVNGGGSQLKTENKKSFKLRFADN